MRLKDRRIKSAAEQSEAEPNTATAEIGRSEPKDTDTPRPVDGSTADVAPDAEVTRVDHEPEHDEDATTILAATSRLRLVTARGFRWVIAPVLTLLLALTAGYLRYEQGSTDDIAAARAESVRAATEGAIALLSYAPDTVDATLGAASNRLTGDFRDSYETLVKQVVSPGAKQKQITATATTPAAASVSATNRHAVVLVFVDQTVVMAKDTPTNTSSAVQVTLDKVDNRWLISGFDPK